jgi:hypothetical protein
MLHAVDSLLDHFSNAPHDLIQQRTHLLLTAGILLLFLLAFVTIQVRKSSSPNRLNSYRTRYLYREDSSLAMLAVELATSVGDYSPPWWYNSYVSAAFELGTIDQQLHSEAVSIANRGATFRVDWFPVAPTAVNNKNKPVVLVLPGLGQTSDDVGNE